MTDEQLQFLAYIINPWNAAVLIVVILAIEVLKRSFVKSFADGTTGNKMLRLMCVVGCIIGFFVPGPWIDSSASLLARLFTGGLLGLLTTMGYEVVAAVIKIFTRLVTRKNAEKEAKAAGAWIDTAKKLGAVLVAIAVTISGLYGAWFKPEDRAQAAYEVTSEGIEALSRDVHRLTVTSTQASAAMIDMDKLVAVELAKLTQRMDYIEADLEKRMSYKPAVITDVEPGVSGGGDAAVVSSPAMANYPSPAPPEFTSPDDFYAGETAAEMMLDDDMDTQQQRPQIKRKGIEMEMPAADELFGR